MPLLFCWSDEAGFLLSGKKLSMRQLEHCYAESTQTPPHSNADASTVFAPMNSFPSQLQILPKGQKLNCCTGNVGHYNFRLPGLLLVTDVFN